MLIAFILVPVLLIAAYFLIRWTPNGMVEFRSGLVLKFLPALDNRPTPKLRETLEKFVAKSAHKVNKKLPVKNVEELSIPTRHGDIKARLYNNSDELQEELLVFFHGGGWCIGSIDTHNEQARRLAIATGLPLLSIDYSLSPEVKFPHAMQEGVDALVWAKENYKKLGISKPKMIPIGDSAGGNMAIGTAMEMIEMGNGDAISRVVPIYPVTDGRSRDTISHQKFGKGYYLTTKAMDVFTSDYLKSHEDSYDVRASPLAQKDVSMFPPCFILTAGFDPLRDEGEAYAQLLHNQGVDVKLKRYPNCIHAFFGLKDFGKQGLIAVDDIAAYLKGQAITGLSQML